MPCSSRYPALLSRKLTNFKCLSAQTKPIPTLSALLLHLMGLMPINATTRSYKFNRFQHNVCTSHTRLEIQVQRTSNTVYLTHPTWYTTDTLISYFSSYFTPFTLRHIPYLVHSSYSLRHTSPHPLLLLSLSGTCLLGTQLKLPYLHLPLILFHTSHSVPHALVGTQLILLVSYFPSTYFTPLTLPQPATLSRCISR